MLWHIQRRAFAGGAHRANGRRAGVHMPIQQAVQSIPVNAAVGVHGGYESDDTALDDTVSHVRYVLGEGQKISGAFEGGQLSMTIWRTQANPWERSTS